MSTDVSVPGKSLVDVIRERRAAEGFSNETYTRFVYVSDIPSGSSSENVLKFHNDIIASLEIGVSGLIAVYPSYCLVYLEAVSDDIIDFLRIVNMNLEKGTSLLRSFRVVGTVEDCPYRFYSSLYVQPVNISQDTSGLGNYHDSTQVSSLLLRNIVSIGVAVLQAGENGSMMINRLTDHFRNLLPSNDIVAAISLNDSLMTIGDYLELFADPFDVIPFTDEVVPLADVFE